MQDAKKAKGANDYDRFAKIELSDDEEEAAPAGKGGAAPEPPAPPPAPPRAPPRAAEPAFEDASAEAKPAAGYRYWAQSKSAPRVVPQKIDPALVPAVEAKGGGSVWNAAGTYEERDQTDWAKQCLAELLASASVGVEGGGTARCTGAKDVQGDAGVHVVRGKKRFVFDLRLSVPFEVELPASAQLFTGEVELTDFSSHEQADWEVSAAVLSARRRRARPASSGSTADPLAHRRRPVAHPLPRAVAHRLGRKAAAWDAALRAGARRGGQRRRLCAGRQPVRAGRDSAARLHRRLQAAVTRCHAPHLSANNPNNSSQRIGIS